MADFECTCSVVKGERDIAWGEDCYCWYPKPNYTERIVRCRDCKYHYEEEPMYSFLLTGQHMCGYWATDHKVKPDGFCSWGKPKEGE